MSDHFTIRYTGPCACCTCCCGLICLLLVILIPISFEYVHYHELAFAKNSISNKVDTSKVYTHGRYLVGPSVTMVKFPKQYQTETFEGSTALQVFNEDGMEFSVEIDFQYRIREDDLMDLMALYGTNYASKVRTIAESTLKNEAIQYSIYDYIHHRVNITEHFNTEVSAAIDEIHLDVEQYKLQLGEIVFPASQMDKYMQEAVTRQNNLQVVYEQNATRVRDETDRAVAAIAAEASLVEREAAAVATRIVEEANAEAEKILSDAYGSGWIDAMAHLGITEDDDISMFLKLIGILDNPSSPQLIESDLNVIVQQSI